MSIDNLFARGVLENKPTSKAEEKEIRWNMTAEILVVLQV